MFELKPLSKEAIPAALAKAERYRLLDEPGEAESICLDILSTDPENQRALVTLLLALTDRFATGHSIEPTEVQAILPRLKSEYERVYYAGVICERRAKAGLRLSIPRFNAFERFREAMAFYERAEELHQPGNDDAVLRWNACARFIMQHHLTESAPEDTPELGLE